MTIFFLISLPTSIIGIYRNQSNQDQRSPSLNIFKSVNLSNYAVFINKNTEKTNEQKIVKNIERKVATIDRLYQLFIDFPCLVQFKKQTEMQHRMSSTYTSILLGGSIKSLFMKYKTKTNINYFINNFLFISESGENCFDCKCGILGL